MKSTGLRILILALVIFSITVVFFIGFKLNIAPHVQSEMDRWVGIATVCTAISSAIVGLISVWVMFDQKKLQDKLMDMQIHEHQPVFKVKPEIMHTVLPDNEYEEVRIGNVGNPSFVIKEWDVKAYGYFRYTYKNETYEHLISFPDYFGMKTDKSEGDDIILATIHSDQRKNVRFIKEINSYGRSVPRGYMFYRIIYTHITYIDLYGNLQTRYFINTLPVDEVEFHRLRNSIKNQHEYFLNEFDIDKFLVKIAFPD